MFVFSMRAKGSDGTIVARQRDRAKVVASKARVRENDEEVSHIRQGEQAQHVLAGGGWQPINFVYLAVLGVEDLELLLDGPEILMMSPLLRMSKYQFRISCR